MKYKPIGPEERVDLGNGRVAFVVPVEPPYPSTLRWRQTVRIEKDGVPEPGPSSDDRSDGT
jgi:hypothetical protein